MTDIDSNSTKKLLNAPFGQKADFVELFFDLVFVFAITQVTHLTAHHLDLTTVLRSVLVFWMIWWGWTMIMWALNAADTRRGDVRAGTLIVTAVAFVMAVSTPQAFDNGVLLFAVSYNLVRLLGMGFYLRVVWTKDGFGPALIFALTSLLGVSAVLIGAISSESARVFWWLGSIAFDLLAGYLGAGRRGLQVQVGHFSERHGLIVIIALGESLIVAGAAVAGDERTAELMTTGGLAVVVTCLLWWTYFAWIREFMEEGLERLEEQQRVLAGRDAFSFGHFPLLCGIISLAVGFENVLSHPEDLLPVRVALALGLGIVLFVGTTVYAAWRITQVFLWGRVIIIICTGVAIRLAANQPPSLALLITAVGLVLIVIIERKKRVKPAKNEVSDQRK